MTDKIQSGPPWFQVAKLVVAITGVIVIIIPFISSPNIVVNFETNQSNLNLSKFQITNTGNARANNLILTFQAPSNITIKSIFSTENYSISSVAGKSTSSTVKIFIPRLAAGSGSIFSVESAINSHLIRESENNDYNLFITSDQGSVKIVTPITTLMTETQQGPSTTDLISVVAFTGLFLWIGSPALIHVGRYYGNPERRASTKIAVIISCVIIGAILFVDLVGLRIIRFSS